ncbi:MAG: RluA family pseudouridine synthase [Gammaproteobacteria bacterium]|nr:RluA family pseudouridine synthase [Gammaproteobacteria bacterium]
MSSNKPQKTSSVRVIEVTSAEVDQRIDNYLIKTLKNIPRTRIYRIIRKGEVRVNKKRIKPDYKLKLGDQVRIPPVRTDSDSDHPVVFSSRILDTVEAAILFENKHLLVIDKPSGLAVHSGSGVAFGVIDLMRQLRPECDMELVHRLDRDTSGCLLLAKHRQSLLALQRCFQDNSISKYYLAVVKGRWPDQLTEVSQSLKKMHMSNGERRVYTDPEGQKALTLIIDNQPHDQYSLITIRLMTGRTHQIRVHCQAEGHEIAGDNKYGEPDFNRNMKKLGMRRLMLHASRLELPHTEFNPEIVINAPVPDVFQPDKTSNLE